MSVHNVKVTQSNTVCLKYHVLVAMEISLQVGPLGRQSQWHNGRVRVVLPPAADDVAALEHQF